MYASGGGGVHGKAYEIEASKWRLSEFEYKGEGVKKSQHFVRTLWTSPNSNARSLILLIALLHFCNIPASQNMIK